ncbi:Pre-mRNA-splicing factor cwf25, partial [Smittium culicis]
MGGGDLNLKKSWHPLTFRNQEKIWKVKQNAEAEKKKIEQIQKELHKERQQEEFQRLQESAGIRKASDRLEWMYSTPATNGQVPTEDLESYLLGKRNIDKLLSSKQKKRDKSLKKKDKSDSSKSSKRHKSTSSHDKEKSGAKKSSSPSKTLNYISIPTLRNDASNKESSIKPTTRRSKDIES